jgi:hypothetical protein
MATAKKDPAPVVEGVVEGSADLPTETRLDTDVHAPATTAPGDAPADTTDPTERASTITPQAPSQEALQAGTILGAVPLPQAVVAQTSDGDDVRVEEYDEIDPRTGQPIRIRHIIDGPDAGKTIRI